MNRDPLVDSVREARHRISEEFDHDPRRIIEYFKELQERHRDRFVKSKPKERASTDESAA